MVEILTLDSGVKMVLDYVDQVESVAIGIWFRTGAVDEKPEYAGISHFLEHMMFKGTENRSPKDIAADIDKIGGQINAFTGKEATCYHVKALSSNYKKAADVLVDMIENSVFDKTEMGRERKVIGEEIKMTLDSPEDLAHDVSSEMIFRGSSLGNSIIGTPTSLKRISQRVMKEYVRDRYTKDNMVISIAGKFKKEEVLEYFNDKFMSLEPKAKKIVEYKAEEYKPTVKVIKKSIEQTHICMGLPTYNLEDPRYYDLLVFNNAFGGTMSSRLFQNIRETKGLAYSVFSMATATVLGGYFKIYAGVAGHGVEAAVSAIKDELNAFDEALITDEELKSSREQLKASYTFSQENTASRMFNNGRMALLLDRVYSIEEIIGFYDGVTLNGINGIKEDICRFKDYSAVAVTGEDKLNLKKFMSN